MNSTIGIDYIEMFTLDANEFLRTKCVCKDQNVLSPTFCKDCFTNFKDSTKNSQSLESKNAVYPNKETIENALIGQIENNLNTDKLSQDNAEIMSICIKNACEFTEVDSGLQNSDEIDGEVRIIENNDGKLNSNDGIVNKNDLVENESEICVGNSLNAIVDCSQRQVVSDQSKINPVKYSDSTIKKTLSEKKISDCFCEMQSVATINPQLRQTNNLSTDSVANQNKKAANHCQCFVPELKTKINSGNREDDLFNDKSAISNQNSHLERICVAELTNNDNSFNSCDLTTIASTPTQNLDLKNARHPTSVLQDLLNPPSTGLNSSATIPRRHQQESAHGEPCASHTSIEANGRTREQAPRCSREFAADVGANDAHERRISQDTTTAIFLNKTQYNSEKSCSEHDQNSPENGKVESSCCEDDVDARVAKERRQHLSWGFRNGRLVFAESKSDLGGSRLQREQVVDSSEYSKDKNSVVAPQNNESFVESNLKLSAEQLPVENESASPLEPPKSVSLNKSKSNLTKDTDCTLNQNPEVNQKQAFGQCELHSGIKSSQQHKHTDLNAQPRYEIEQVGDDLEINECSTDGIKLNNSKEESCQDILYSRDINKRLEDSSSRLKYLEDKLKKAGIIDQSPELPETNAKVPCFVVNKEKIGKESASQNICESEDQNLGRSEDTKESGESNEILDHSESKSKTKSSENPKRFTTLAKNHQYNLAHDSSVIADKQSLDVNKATEETVIKYTDYSEFQKEDTSSAKTSLDSNQNIVEKDDCVEGEDLIPEDSQDFCQFDVNNFSGFSFNANQGYYDESTEDSSSEDSCDCDDEEDHFIVIRRMRGDGSNMVNDDRTKHNPDRANLKSLLKKPGRTKDKKSNRVVFNENKNEFFDADYIILIREECDYDEDDDDGVCTCNQHEMVRLTCCEPNCNCQGYDNFEQTPQSPKFAPPIEFVDAVTLSPPEGYKDMELMAASRGQQRGAVCRECSATHEEEMEDEGEISQSDSEMDGQIKEQEEKEKTDQSQQTTPTTPPSSENAHNQNYILETITMTTVSQQQILRETEEAKKSQMSSQGSPISGILKGGRLWKQQSQPSLESAAAKSGEQNLVSSDSVTSDDETGNRRSVRFIESEEKEARDICDGAAESSPEEETTPNQNVHKIPNIESQISSNSKQETYIGNSTSPDATEMTLTFKLGNHVLISNNSLKPNSAVRQLFPCTKTLPAGQAAREEENSQQYLVTAESLRAFEEAKRSKLPQIIQSGETDETIKRAIERNTLRRSLIRYEPRSKKQPYKTDNSLVERIKQLTCDVDSKVNSEQPQQQSSIESSDPSEDVLDSRSSPPGEESRNSPDVNSLGPNKNQDKSFSPSSSSSSSSMSLNQNYHQMRKLSGSGEQALMMVMKRAETIPDIQNNFRRETKPLPDIGGPHNHDPTDPPRAVASQPPDLSHCVISNKMSSGSITSESRRQFLAPLTACVTMGVAHNEDYYYHLSNNSHNHPGERLSVASSGTEYSLDDIEEGLKNEDEEHKRIAPDVLAGTPSASESGDELAMFVQQDAGRIERIKKKYQATDQQPKENKNNDEDDEHDDYGFNRRPSVRVIKPRFSTTTEILQQIQNQLQPPAPPPTRVAWPYYSESGLTDNSKQKNANQNAPANYQYANVSEEAKTRGYPSAYRPTSLQDETALYQNCTNQRCLSGDVYHRSNVNTYSPVVRMGNEYYQSLPVNRPRNGRPQSPPPMDMSKQYHQTMVYIPYNHIEGYQPVQYYQHTGSSDYVSRVSNQNQINKRYVEPVYQSRVHHNAEDHHYNPSIMPPVPPKALGRVPYPNGQPPPHMMGSRSESPLPGQFSTARSTQTPAPAMSTGGYYPSNTRYRPMVGPVWQGEGTYAAKINRHSYPVAGPRYPPADSISLTDSDSQHSGCMPNGYRQSDISGYVSKDSMPNSPTKPRFIERGVPEGAASVSPQDLSGVSQSSSSTMTSPTSPQNPPVPTNQKPLFYAMNV